MTIVEKAAYFKGLVEGLGVDPESKDGKLWNALTDVLAAMAHEIEDLQASDLDFAEAIDEISEDLTYLEELTCDFTVRFSVDLFAHLLKMQLFPDIPLVGLFDILIQFQGVCHHVQQIVNGISRFAPVIIAGHLRFSCRLAILVPEVEIAA